MVLIATLMLFGFWPKPMLDVLDGSVSSLHYRIENGIEQSVETGALVRDVETPGSGAEGGAGLDSDENAGAEGGADR